MKTLLTIAFLLPLFGLRCWGQDVVPVDVEHAITDPKARKLLGWDKLTKEERAAWGMLMAFHAQQQVNAALKGSAVAGASGGGRYVAGSTLTIKKVLSRGEMLLMDDGSIWEIGSLSRIDSSLWMAMDELTVAPNKGGFLPYLLINRSDRTSAEAKPIR